MPATHGEIGADTGHRDRCLAPNASRWVPNTAGARDYEHNRHRPERSVARRRSEGCTTGISIPHAAKYVHPTRLCHDHFLTGTPVRLRLVGLAIRDDASRGDCDEAAVRTHSSPVVGYAALDHQVHHPGGAGTTSAGVGMSWRAGRSPLLVAHSRNGPSSPQRMGRK